MDNSAQHALAGTEIILVRHGRTVWNEQKRLQGSEDSPLTAAGVAAARELGRRLAAAQTGSPRPIEHGYTSPLGRARKTAEIVVAEINKSSSRDRRVQLEDDAGLRERSFGVLEGLTSEESAARHPEAHRRTREREDDYVTRLRLALAPIGERLRWAQGRP